MRLYCFVERFHGDYAEKGPCKEKSYTEKEPCKEEQQAEKELCKEERQAEKELYKEERQAGGDAWIEFRNVWFRYAGTEKYALENVSVQLRRGDIITIVGENCSGKTTFVKLLLGLYRLPAGKSC